MPDSNVCVVRLSPLLAGIALLAACARSNAVPWQTQGAVARPAHARSHALLYVSDAGNDEVGVFTYPALKLVATLTGFGAVAGLCESTTDVFVVDAQKDEVVRYARGAKTPSKVLYDQGYHPNGCAVDPVTGKLAVALRSESSGRGVLAIFAHGGGRPVYYGTANIATPAYCAFDNEGDLFIDGTDELGNFAFGEMPVDYRTVFSVTLDQTIAVPGGIQWDGTYIAVGDEGEGSQPSTIYQFTVSAFTGTLEGTVHLGQSARVEQFWVGKTKLIGPNSGSSRVKVWAYPAGGTPIRSLGGFEEPVATVLSPA